MDLGGDAVREFLGALPHSVVGYGDLVLLIGRGPLGVLSDYLHRVVAPDDAVRRRYHLDGKGEFVQLGELAGEHGRERVEDVHEILHRLLPQQALVGLVVEQFAHREMLAESVHREEDVVAGEEGGHGIRPVEHGHLYELQFLAVADLQTVAGLDDVEVPALLPELAFEALHGVGGAVERRAGNLPQEFRQRTRMVYLAVVDDDGVYLAEVAQLRFQVLYEFIAVRRPYGVHQYGLLLLDEVCVLAGAVADGVFVAVEGLEFPVEVTHPADIVLDLFSHCAFVSGLVKIRIN